MGIVKSMLSYGLTSDLLLLEVIVMQSRFNCVIMSKASGMPEGSSSARFCAASLSRDAGPRFPSQSLAS